MSHEYALKDVPLVRIMIKWLNLSFPNNISFWDNSNLL